jgi:hypothetical protein
MNHASSMRCCSLQYLCRLNKRSCLDLAGRGRGEVYLEHQVHQHLSYGLLPASKLTSVSGITSKTTWNKTNDGLLHFGDILFGLSLQCHACRSGRTHLLKEFEIASSRWQEKSASYFIQGLLIRSFHFIPISINRLLSFCFGVLHSINPR